MAIDFKKTQEKLDRLRRNEEKMTPAQRQQWKKNLQAYRNQIIAECNEIMREFLFGDLKVLKGDKEGEELILRNLDAVIKKQVFADGRKKAKEVLFQTYSLHEFLDAICPMHTEIWFLVYGPYWITKTVTDPATGEMTNALVDAIWNEKFYWNAEHGQWEGKEKLTWTIMLPPTKELLDKAYREEVERYGDYASSKRQDASGGR